MRSKSFYAKFETNWPDTFGFSSKEWQTPITPVYHCHFPALELSQTDCDTHDLTTACWTICKRIHPWGSPWLYKYPNWNHLSLYLFLYREDKLLTKYLYKCFFLNNNVQRKYLLLATILFKIVRSSMAEISMSLDKSKHYKMITFYMFIK